MISNISTVKETSIADDFAKFIPKDIKDKIDLNDYVGIRWIITDEGNLKIELEKKQRNLKDLTKYSIKGLEENIDIVELKKKVGRGEI